MLFQQPEACLAGLAQNHLLLDAMVRAISVTLYNSHPSAGLKRHTQIAHQNNRVCYLVIGLEEEYGIDAVGGQLGIVGPTQDRLDVLQLLFVDAIVDVVDGFRIDVDGIDFTCVRDSLGGANSEPS